MTSGAMGTALWLLFDDRNDPRADIHTRCAVRERLLNDLHSRKIDEGLRIVIVDSGRTNGSPEILLNCAQSTTPNVTVSVIEGDSS